MAYLPNLTSSIRPSDIEEPQLQFSQSHKKAIELELSIDEVLDGSIPSIDFSGTDVTRFAAENGKKLIENKNFSLGSAQTLS